ncbi:MAG: succinylglutamate desuccinylase/aspartoacylase family protein [Halioglobus sp.]
MPHILLLFLFSISFSISVPVIAQTTEAEQTAVASLGDQIPEEASAGELPAEESTSSDASSGPEDTSVQEPDAEETLVEVQPAEVQPAEVQPAEVQPAEVQPVEAQPVEAQPVEVQPTAENINLKEVIPAPEQPPLFPGPETEAAEAEAEVLPAALPEDPNDPKVVVSTESVEEKPNQARSLLGVDILPATTTRLNWTASRSFSGMAVDTPVLVVNGAYDGPTLCLTAAIHGDELNGIEMVRRVMYDLDPLKLHGMVVGVPIVNLLGFSRNSRYLPDRRDLNRFFPGNASGSVASRIAFAFFRDVIKHCNALVDLHTGSFHRTNITQLRADMSNPGVVEFASYFGDIPVLNTPGNPRSLRAAAVVADIPTVTLEAGEPMRMQVEVVEEGVTAINTLLEKNGMYPSFSLWAKPSPAYYRSTWVRANTSGILFSHVKPGDVVQPGDVLGEVINPVTNERSDIASVHDGRILGMALDQFVLPGFAAYHIGILQPMGEDLQAVPPGDSQPLGEDEDEMSANGGQSIPSGELLLSSLEEEENGDE